MCFELPNPATASPPWRTDAAIWPFRLQSDFPAIGQKQIYQRRHLRNVAIGIGSDARRFLGCDGAISLKPVGRWRDDGIASETARYFNSDETVAWVCRA